MWGTRVSVAMVLTMKNKQLLVFNEKVFQLPAPPQYQEMIENINYFYAFGNNSNQPELRYNTINIS